jgi:hypothetical protein
MLSLKNRGLSLRQTCASGLWIPAYAGTTAHRLVPANAGIHTPRDVMLRMDPGLRRDDGS